MGAKKKRSKGGSPEVPAKRPGAPASGTPPARSSEPEPPKPASAEPALSIERADDAPASVDPRPRPGVPAPQPAPASPAATATVREGNVFARAARRFFRTDPLFPFALAGAILVCHAFPKLVSDPLQPFDKFVEVNRETLIRVAAGLALFFVGCLGKAADVFPGGAGALGFGGRARRKAARTAPEGAPIAGPAAAGASRPAALAAGWLLLALGAAAVVWAWRWSVANPFSVRGIGWLAIGMAAGGLGARLADFRRHRIASVAVGGAAAIAGAWALYETWQDTLKAPTGLDGVVFLFVAMALLVFGSALVERPRDGWLRDLGVGRYARPVPFLLKDGPWIAAILVAWAWVAVQQLDERPGYFTGDESLVCVYGLACFDPVGGEKLSPPWRNVFEPFLGCFPRGLALRFFSGPPPLDLPFLEPFFNRHPYFGGRLYGVMNGMLVLSLVFVLARRFFGRPAAWLTFLLVGTSHVYLSFARSAYTNLDSILLPGLWILGMGAAWKSGRFSLALLAGMAAGLTYYTYPASLAVLPLAAGVFGIQLIREPRALIRRWWVILAMVVGLLISSSPNRIFWRENPKGRKFRENTVFLLSKDKIQDGFAQTGADSVVGVLVEKSWPAIGGMFLWQHAGLEMDFASNRMPIVDRRTAGLFLLGLVGAAALWRRRFVYLAFLAWFGAVAVFGSLLTTNPPYVPRLLGALASGYFLAGWVMAGLVERARRLAGWWLALPLLAAAIVFSARIARENWKHYYVDHIQNLNNIGYRRVPTGMMDFLDKLNKEEEHLVYWGTGYYQFPFGGFLLFDDGFSRELKFDANAPIPRPHPRYKRTAYVVQLPDFVQVDRKLAAMFPGVEPETIYPRILGDSAPPTQKVYWVERGTQPVGVGGPGSAAPGAIPPAGTPAGEGAGPIDGFAQAYEVDQIMADYPFADSVKGPLMLTRLLNRKAGGRGINWATAPWTGDANRPIVFPASFEAEPKCRLFINGEPAVDFDPTPGDRVWKGQNGVSLAYYHVGQSMGYHGVFFLWLPDGVYPGGSPLDLGLEVHDGPGDHSWIGLRDIAAPMALFPSGFQPKRP